MKRIFDKAVMYGIVGAVLVLCIFEMLTVMPDEIRWQRQRRKEWRQGR